MYFSNLRIKQKYSRDEGLFIVYSIYTAYLGNKVFFLHIFIMWIFPKVNLYNTLGRDGRYICKSRGHLLVYFFFFLNNILLFIFFIFICFAKYFFFLLRFISSLFFISNNGIIIHVCLVSCDVLQVYYIMLDVYFFEWGVFGYYFSIFANFTHTCHLFKILLYLFGLVFFLKRVKCLFLEILHKEKTRCSFLSVPKVGESLKIIIDIWVVNRNIQF